MDDRLLSSACVLLSSKFCEIDDNLIMIKEIQDFMKNYNYQSSKEVKYNQKQSPLTRFSYLKYEDIARTELQVLQRFEWDLFRILPLDFLEIYLLMMKKIGGTKLSTVNQVKKFGDQLCEQVMLEHDKYMQFMPSDIALAVLVAAFNQLIESNECLISKQECEYLSKQIFVRIYTLVEQEQKQYQFSDNFKIVSLNLQYPNKKSVILALLKLITGQNIEIEKLIPKKLTYLKNGNAIQHLQDKSNQKPSQNSSYICTPGKNINLDSGSKRSFKNQIKSNTITANKEIQPIGYSGINAPIRLFVQSSSQKKQQNQSCQSSKIKNYIVRSPQESNSSVQKFTFKNAKQSQDVYKNNLQIKLSEINQIASSNNLLKLVSQNIYEQKEVLSNGGSLNNYNSLNQNCRKSTIIQKNQEDVYSNMKDLYNQKTFHVIKNEQKPSLGKLQAFKDDYYYNQISNPAVNEMKKSLKTSDQFSDLQELSPLSDQIKDNNFNKQNNYDSLQDANGQKKFNETRLTLEFQKKFQLNNQYYYKKQNQNINYAIKNEKTASFIEFESKDINKPLYYKKQNEQNYDNQQQYNYFNLKKYRSQTTDVKQKDNCENQKQDQELNHDQLQQKLTLEVNQYEQKQKSMNKKDPIETEKRHHFQSKQNKQLQKQVFLDIKKDFNEIEILKNNENGILKDFTQRKSESLQKVDFSKQQLNVYAQNYFLQDPLQQFNILESSKLIQKENQVKKQQKQNVNDNSSQQIKNNYFANSKTIQHDLYPQEYNRIEKQEATIQHQYIRKNSLNPQKSNEKMQVQKQQIKKTSTQYNINSALPKGIDSRPQSLLSSKRSISQIEIIQQFNKQSKDKLNLMSTQQLDRKIQNENMQRIQSDTQCQYFSAKPNSSQKIVPNEINKKNDNCKNTEKNLKIKIPNQAPSSKDQLSNRNIVQKLVSPQNKINEIQKNQNEIIRNTPTNQLTQSRNKLNQLDRKQNTISQNSMNINSQKCQTNDQTIGHNDIQIKIQNDKNQKLVQPKQQLEKAQLIQNKVEEGDFTCSPVKYKRRNLSAIFQSSSSSQRNQISGLIKIEDMPILPTTDEQIEDAESINNSQELRQTQNFSNLSQENQIYSLYKNKNSENPILQNYKKQSIEIISQQTRGAVSTLKSMKQIKNESRYPSVFGDQRAIQDKQNQQRQSDSRVKSQLQYNSSHLRSPNDQKEIISQKLMSILNEGKISVISDSIKEEEEFNASNTSQKNQKFLQSKNFTLGMGLSSAIQRLSLVQEEQVKTQTKKSHYLNILRDHIQKQQNNKKYGNKIIDKQETLKLQPSPTQQKQEQTLEINSSTHQNSLNQKKSLQKIMDNPEQTQKSLTKQTSYIQENKGNKLQQESLKTLQTDASQSQLKAGIEKQRFGSTQKKTLSIISEESKIKFQKNQESISNNQTLNKKNVQLLEKVEQQQQIGSQNYKFRQSVITPKQLELNAQNKLQTGEHQIQNLQLSAQNKKVQKKYPQQQYLQSNKSQQKNLICNETVKQKENEKINLEPQILKEKNPIVITGKKQIQQAKDSKQFQTERQKTPLTSEIINQGELNKIVKKSEQSSIMSQISNTSLTNKIIKPSLKYNNPFKSQNSNNQLLKKTFFINPTNQTNQQQGNSLNTEENSNMYNNLQIENQIIDQDSFKKQGDVVQVKEINLFEKKNNNQENKDDQLKIFNNTLNNYKNQTARILQMQKISSSNQQIKESQSQQQIEQLLQNSLASSEKAEVNQFVLQEGNSENQEKIINSIKQNNNNNTSLKKNNSISNYEFQSYFLNKQRRSIEILTDKKLIKNKLDSDKQLCSIQTNRKINRNSIQTEQSTFMIQQQKKLNDYKQDLQKFFKGKQKNTDTDKGKVETKSFQKRNQSNLRLKNGKLFNYSQKSINEISNINEEISNKNQCKNYKIIQSNFQNSKSQKTIFIDNQQDEVNSLDSQYDDQVYNKVKQQILQSKSLSGLHKDIIQFTQNEEELDLKDEDDEEEKLLNDQQQDFKNLKKRRSALERKSKKVYQLYDK